MILEKKINFFNTEKTNKQYNKLKYSFITSDVSKEIVYLNSLSLSFVESVVIYNFIIQLKFNYLDNFLQKSLTVIDYACHIQNLKGDPSIVQFQSKKDDYLKDSFYFSWSRFFIEDKNISKSRFYLDFFSSKVGMPLFNGTFFRKELGKQWLLLLRSSSVFVIKCFLSKKLDSRFDVDVLPTALDYSSICKISSESSQLNLDSWFFLFRKFYTCSLEFGEYNQNSIPHIDFKYDYLLPYSFTRKTNYDVVCYQLLPFLSQYDHWAPDNDGYGYSKAIAQRSLQKPQKTLYVFGLEGNTIKILKKKDLLSRFSSKLISFGIFSYNWVPFFARVQKKRFTDRHLFSVSLGLLDKMKYFNDIFYRYFLNPVYNFSKMVLCCSFLLYLYPLKNLLEADNCILYFFDSTIVFLVIYSVLLSFKLLWYFLVGAYIKASKFDIDINVAIFTFIVAFILFSILGDLIYEPFLMFKKWYVKSIL